MARNRRYRRATGRASNPRRRITIHTGDPHALFQGKNPLWNSGAENGCSCGAGVVPVIPPSERERIRERSMKGYGSARFGLDGRGGWFHNGEWWIWE